MPRDSIAKPGLPLLGRIGLVTLFAALAGGCSLTSVPLNEPVFTGSTANQRANLQEISVMRPRQYGFSPSGSSQATSPSSGTSMPPRSS
jgi:hypothetical protein